MASLHLPVETRIASFSRRAGMSHPGAGKAAAGSTSKRFITSANSFSSAIIFIQFFISIDKKNSLSPSTWKNYLSFGELENGVVITLVRSLCAFIFQETCFWPAHQIPIQRRRRIIHVHAFFCFKCDNAYRSAITVCAAMFNAVIPVDALMHVSPAQDFFCLFPLLLHSYLSAPFVQ